MNTGLKAILVAVFEAITLALDTAQKKGITVEIGDLISLGQSIPAILANVSDLKSEVAAITQEANQADLLAFIATEFSAVTTDARVQAILSACLKLISDLPAIEADTLGLVAAIKG